MKGFWVLSGMCPQPRPICVKLTLQHVAQINLDTVCIDYQLRIHDKRASLIYSEMLIAYIAIRCRVKYISLLPPFH